MIDHYENPRNVGSLDKNDTSVGTGLVGAPACGDVMKLQVCTVLQCVYCVHITGHRCGVAYESQCRLDGLMV